MATPVPVRPAATVMLVRDGPAGIQVLMLRRNPTVVFSPGAYVFPGGALEDADGAAAECSDGLTDRQASDRLGLAAGGMAYWVAAIRECFEESGILLARQAGVPVSLSDAQAARRFTRFRTELHQGVRTLPSLCHAEGLRLALDQLYYFAHRVTPLGSVRRYDTRFFLAAAPVGQRAAHDGHETVADVWIEPAEALRRFERDVMPMVLPTVLCLRVLSQFSEVAPLLEAASRSTGEPLGQAPPATTASST